MKCKHCGTENVEGSRFCQGCCAPIEYDRETLENLEKKRARKEKDRKNKKAIKKAVKISMTVCSLCLVGLVCFQFYNRQSNTVSFDVIDKVANDTISNKTDDGIKESGNQKVSLERVPLDVGETISSTSYIITFKSMDIIDKNNEKAILYSVPKGKEYVLINIALTNRSKSDVIYTSLYQFLAYVDNQELVENLSGILAEGLPSISGPNQKGHTKEGYIAYCLEEGWKEIKVAVSIDKLDNEPYLRLENPKNREISSEEIEKIMEDCHIEDFLRDNLLWNISTSEVENAIVEFMHEKMIYKGDFVPSDELQQYIAKKVS